MFRSAACACRSSHSALRPHAVTLTVRMPFLLPGIPFLPSLPRESLLILQGPVQILFLLGQLPDCPRENSLSTLLQGYLVVPFGIGLATFSHDPLLKELSFLCILESCRAEHRHWTLLPPFVPSGGWPIIGAESVVRWIEPLWGSQHQAPSPGSEGTWGADRDLAFPCLSCPLGSFQSQVGCRLSLSVVGPPVLPDPPRPQAVLLTCHVPEPQSSLANPLG